MMLKFKDATELDPLPKTKCGLDDNEACCCVCRFHVPDHSHPSTDGGKFANQRGWVCLAPEFPHVHSGWPEHGMCEMFVHEDTPRPDISWVRRGDTFDVTVGGVRSGDTLDVLIRKDGN